MPDPAGINTRRAARRSLDGTRTAYSNAASQPCHPSPHCFATIRSDEQACVSLRLLKEMNGLPESVTGLPCTQVLDSTHGLKWGLRGGGFKSPSPPSYYKFIFARARIIVNIKSYYESPYLYARTISSPIRDLKPRFSPCMVPLE